MMNLQSTTVSRAHFRAMLYRTILVCHMKP